MVSPFCLTGPQPPELSVLWSGDFSLEDWETQFGEAYVRETNVGTQTVEQLTDGTWALTVENQSTDDTGCDRRWQFSAMTGVPSSPEMWLSYRMFIPEGTDFGGGGKFPGLAGKDGDSVFDLAWGGNRPGDSWSERAMFGGDGSVRSYLYVEDPVSPNYPNGDARVSPLRYIPGWNSVLQRVVVNSASTSDGILQMWVNDQLVMDLDDLRYVEDGDVNPSLIVCHWGYGAPATYPSTPQWTRFADFKLLEPV